MEEKIFERIQEHLKYVTSQLNLEPNQFFGIFLYGSQNYDTANETSDVDTKMVIVPTMEDLINSNCYVKTFILPNEEHCEVMDIRHWTDNLLKQNINFIETLYTEYCIINPFYLELFNSLNKEEISHYDMEKALQSIKGQVKHTLKEIDNFTDYKNIKKIHNGYRLAIFLQKYSKNLNYEDCIKLKRNDFVMKIKNKEIPIGKSDIDKINHLLDNCQIFFNTTIEEKLKIKENIYSFNEKVIRKFDKVRK